MNNTINNIDEFINIINNTQYYINNDIVYASNNKVININEFILINQYDKNIKLLINELINKKYKFNIEYIYKNINLDNEWIKLILNVTCEKDKNILYKFINNPIKFEQIITKLNIKPNNTNNLIGILNFIEIYLCDCLDYKEYIIYYNLSLKHEFKFPNFLSFLFAYIFCKNTINYNIKYLSKKIYNFLKKIVNIYENTNKDTNKNTNKDNKSLQKIYNREYLSNKNEYDNLFFEYNILNEYKLLLSSEDNIINNIYTSITDKLAEKILKEQYNKLPKDVNNNHELFEIIYKNPYKMLEYDEFNKYIKNEEITFDENMFYENYNELKLIYYGNQLNSPLNWTINRMFDTLEELWQENYPYITIYID